MPNPYHDAEGKFASRDGMKQAIQEAETSNDFITYARLREEFEEIDKQNQLEEEANRAELAKDFDTYYQRKGELSARVLSQNLKNPNFFAIDLPYQHTMKVAGFSGEFTHIGNSGGVFFESDFGADNVDEPWIDFEHDGNKYRLTGVAEYDDPTAVDFRGDDNITYLGRA